MGQRRRVLVTHIQIHAPALPENFGDVFRSGFPDDEVVHRCQRRVLLIARIFFGQLNLGRLKIFLDLR